MANSEIAKSGPNLPHRPVDIFGSMRDEMDRMFERFEHALPRLPAIFNHSNGRQWLMPEIDVRDTGKQLSVDIELPGVDEKDVTVSLANGILTIRGEKKSEHEETIGQTYMAERSYGAFERALRLPDSVDEGKLEARFDKGVLKIVAPKRPEALKAEKKIEIKKS